MSGVSGELLLPPLRVLLLGPPKVRVGDEEFRIRGNKQRILLAHLVLSGGRPVSVDVLVNDLWPQAPPRNVTHALQAHASRLRLTLGVEIEFMEEAGYRLAGDQFETDIQQFSELTTRARARLEGRECHAAIALYEQALDLWRGPALGDLADVEGLRPVVQHLQEMRRSAESERIDAYLRFDKGEAVIGALRALLEDDHLHEPTWHQLMHALAQAGRRQEALTTYHRAREVFIEELGAEPSEALSQTHVELLRLGEPAAESAPEGGPIASTQSLSRLIGRENEFALLAGAWSANEGGLRIATISGEPGVGKSWLAAEFARRAAAGPGQVLTGSCLRAVSTPYQPFVEVFRSWMEQADDHGAVIGELAQRHGVGLAQVLPELHVLDHSVPDPVTVEHRSSEDHQSMDAIAAWLAAISSERRLVLVLDDLQWADEQTLLLVHHLVRNPRRINGLIIATIRDRVIIDGDESAAAAGPVLSKEFLRQSDKVTHVPLARLTAAETEELARSEAAKFALEPLPAWAGPYVRAASGGNPLFVVELVRHLLTSGATSSDQVPPAPSGLREVIESQVRSLPLQVQSLLRQAAVIGATYEPEVLAEVAGVGHREIDTMLETTTRTGITERVPGAGLRYTFSHDVVRAVLSEALPPLERANLHTHIAHAIEARHDGDPGDHHELAHHYRLSDSPQAAVNAARHMYLAGRDALSRGASADAERLLAEALDLLGPRAEATTRCDLLIALGEAQLRCAMPQYRASLLEATRLATELADAPRLTRAVLLNTRGWWSSTAEVDHERVAGIETALSVCDPDDLAVRARLLAAWSVENVRDPASRSKVLQYTAQARELADRSKDPAAIATSLASRYSVTYALFEDPFAGVRLSQQLLEFAQARGDRRMRLSASICVSQANMRFGQFTIADRYLTQAVHLAEAIEHPPRLWLLRGWQAMRTAMRGRLDDAEKLAAENYEFGTRIEQADAGTWYAGQMFTFRLMQGRLPEILGEVDQQVAAVADTIPAWRAAAALALAQSGRREPATAILDGFAAGGFDQLPQDFLWLNAMNYLSMTCEVLGRDDLAPDLYRILVPYAGMVATNGTVDAGPVDLQLGSLALLFDEPELAEEHLSAAAGLCREIDAPVWLEPVEERRAGRGDRGVAPGVGSPASR